MNEWTEERIVRLRRLHKDGFSYAEIAHALGVSRAAALGKAHRLGMSLSRTVKAERSKVAKTPRRIANDGAMIRRGGMRSFERATFFDLPAETSPVAATFMNLKPGTCRWPISGNAESILFCGAVQAEDGCSYCEAHKMRSVARREAA